MYQSKFHFDMPTLRRKWTIGAALLLTTLVCRAAPEGEAIMQKGGANPAALPCITCHAPDGKGMAAAGFPRLAGLPAAFIAKQLKDFKQGLRQNPLMQPIAAALTDEEVSAIANAYAARPRVNVQAQPAGVPPEGSGAWIALRGAWERNIPECTLCHGPAGVGVDQAFPPLAGQGALYLENQL
jgi:cytochrome c553